MNGGTLIARKYVQHIFINLKLFSSAVELQG